MAYRSSIIAAHPDNKKREEEIRAGAAAALQAERERMLAANDATHTTGSAAGNAAAGAVSGAISGAASGLGAGKDDNKKFFSQIGDAGGLGIAPSGPPILTFRDAAQATGYHDAFYGWKDTEKTDEGGAFSDAVQNQSKDEGKGDDASDSKKDQPDNMDQNDPAVPMADISAGVNGKPSSVYQSVYEAEIERLLKELSGREPFSYDYESDPRYAAYKKEYLREADRTAEDTMGLYAGMTGGVPSTAAISAASQAANAYKGQLADKIPELEALAYDMYLDELNQSRRDLETLRDLDNTAYSRWYTENRDAVADTRYEENLAYNRKLEEEAAAAAEADALLAEWKKGGTVLSEEQADALGMPSGMTYETYLNHQKQAGSVSSSANDTTAAESAEELFAGIYQNSRNEAEYVMAMNILLNRNPLLKNKYVRWAAALSGKEE